MNDKDKEAFIDWYKNKKSEFDNCKEAWKAACEYKREEYSNIMDAITQTSQYNFKLQAENKKLIDMVIELKGLIEFEYGDCNCDSQKKCSFCKVMDELIEWREAARSEADEVNRLQAENKKLRDALEIYANAKGLVFTVKGLHLKDSRNVLSFKLQEPARKSLKEIRVN